MTEKVQVVARLCPPRSPHSSLSAVPLDEHRLCVSNRRVYDVDRVYSIKDSTEYIFYDRVAALVDRFLAGYNTTVLAYGQTGSGKTFTMNGLAPLILRYTVERMGGSTKGLSFQCVEVYGDVLRDLLTSDPAGSSKHLNIHDVDNNSNHRNGTGANAGANNCGASVIVVGAARVKARSFEEIQEIIDYSSKMRATGATQMNEHSSRSHSVFTIFNHERQSKLNLVDLAGSERNKKTHNVGLRFRESCAINGGLLALGNVIRAVSRNSFTHPETPQHVPYRSSKLTRLLQDSLGGNSTTLLIACVASDADNTDETIRTMQYSALATRIVNEPVLHFDAPAMTSPLEGEEYEAGEAEDERLREHKREQSNDGTAPHSSEEVMRLRRRVAGLEGHLQRCREELKNDEAAFAQQIKYTRMLLQENEQLKLRIASLEARVSSKPLTSPARVAGAAGGESPKVRPHEVSETRKQQQWTPSPPPGGSNPSKDVVERQRNQEPLQKARGVAPLQESYDHAYTWEGEKTIVSTQVQRQHHFNSKSVVPTAWNEPTKGAELLENISNINHVNDSGSLCYEFEKEVPGRGGGGEDQLNLLAKEALYYQNSNSELRRRLRVVMALYEAQQREAAMLRHEVEQIRELIDGKCQM